MVCTLLLFQFCEEANLRGKVSAEGSMDMVSSCDMWLDVWGELVPFSAARRKPKGWVFSSVQSYMFILVFNAH